MIEGQFSSRMRTTVKSANDGIDMNTNSASKYTIDFRVASESNGGKIALSLVEQNTSREYVILSELDIPPTGGWQDWVTEL